MSKQRLLGEVKCYKCPSGLFLLNPRREGKYHYIVISKGNVTSSSTKELIGKKPVFRKERWEIKIGMLRHTRIYHPIWDGKPLEIFQGSPQGKINEFFLGPFGPSEASLHYGPGGVYTVVDGKVKGLNKLMRVQKGKTVSIWVDGFPLLVEKPNSTEVENLLYVLIDIQKCEQYSRQVDIENCPAPPTRCPDHK